MSDNDRGQAASGQGIQDAARAAGQVRTVKAVGSWLMSHPAVIAGIGFAVFCLILILFIPLLIASAYYWVASILFGEGATATDYARNGYAYETEQVVDTLEGLLEEGTGSREYFDSYLSEIYGQLDDAYYDDDSGDIITGYGDYDVVLDSGDFSYIYDDGLCGWLAEILQDHGDEASLRYIIDGVSEVNGTVVSATGTARMQMVTALLDAAGGSALFDLYETEPTPYVYEGYVRWYIAVSGDTPDPGYLAGWDTETGEEGITGYYREFSEGSGVWWRDEDGSIVYADSYQEMLDSLENGLGYSVSESTYSELVQRGIIYVYLVRGDYEYTGFSGTYSYVEPDSDEEYENIISVIELLDGNYSITDLVKKVLGIWNWRSITTEGEEDGMASSSASQSNQATEELRQYIYSTGLFGWENLSSDRLMICRVAADAAGNIPYNWGGKPTSYGFYNAAGQLVLNGVPGAGLDCAAFVDWVFWTAVGDNLGKSTTSGLVSYVSAISVGQAQPGDLIFKKPAGSSSTLDNANHVMIYLGRTGDGLWVFAEAASSEIGSRLVAYDASPYAYWYTVNYTYGKDW